MRTTFVIVTKPGCTPVLKHPAPDADRTALRDMLRELVEHMPYGTVLTVAHVGEPFGLDVQCGREWLSMFDRRWKPKTKPLFISSGCQKR